MDGTFCTSKLPLRGVQRTKREVGTALLCQPARLLRSTSLQLILTAPVLSRMARSVRRR